MQRTADGREYILYRTTIDNTVATAELTPLGEIWLTIHVFSVDKWGNHVEDFTHASVEREDLRALLALADEK